MLDSSVASCMVVLHELGRADVYCIHEGQSVCFRAFYAIAPGPEAESFAVQIHRHLLRTADTPPGSTALPALGLSEDTVVRIEAAIKDNLQSMLSARRG